MSFGANTTGWYCLVLIFDDPGQFIVGLGLRSRPIRRESSSMTKGCLIFYAIVNLLMQEYKWE
jgi:hypothetical protein